MKSYRLTLAAQRDIREIVRHIRFVQKSPQNALLVATRLKAKFAALVRTPQLGHQQPELDDATALIVNVTGLMVVYDPTLKPLTILRVIHPARDLGRIDVRN
jgi:toxin ParE1/3/4